MVLMAYDLPLMGQGELVLHWTTRYSIRNIVQGFEQASKDMNLVADNYFGKNMGDLVKKRITDKSRVELGKIEVIGTEELTDSKKQSLNQLTRDSEESQEIEYTSRCHLVPTWIKAGVRLPVLLLKWEY
tara:strand:+ start:397 stop:783 length:387 start_codon:yes stop_codon:yes gene_type:complete